MKLDTVSLEELRQGYKTSEKAMQCSVCGKVFENGEIFEIDGRFFSAERAVAKHMESEHSDYTSKLILSDLKYNNLTENQKKLFLMISEGYTDKQIAEQTKTSLSTVRHQKFMFREKAKQAKLYLAIYENAFAEKTDAADAIIPVHDNAPMLDDRFIVTKEERDEMMAKLFYSLEPLRLKTFPPKEKKKFVILSAIAEKFGQGKVYTEKEVNEIIKPVFDDYVTIRRYLIQYGFMERTKDGKQYWLS